MAPAAPPPEHVEDPVIHVAEGAFTASVALVHRPALDLPVQGPNQFPRRAVASLPPYHSPDPGQERLEALLRWLHDHLAVAEAPHRLAEEIEAVLDRRDPGLLVGEL